MRLFVGVTDGDWFRHLAATPAIGRGLRSWTDCAGRGPAE